MKLHKQSLIALSLSLALGTWAGIAQAADPAHKTIDLSDARGAASVVSVTGEITAVDVANRIVSIKGPKGNISDMRVDPKVKNLEQVKVGDLVRLTYRVGIALALMKGGDGIREKVETEGAAKAERGAKPGGAVVKRTTIVADVEGVDAKKKIVTLKGPSGQIVDVRVNDSQVLRDTKVGDQVVASITESLALRVSPASAK
ncbi:hypothetical protein QTI66_34395 [Variovorax sp. J22R133]|uniref:hypothetical protein n=1 Tax=Variovorax brevis TaxID=3053503 RepID=UPI00257805F0|nr:hypothetical protein [Variovorax sp. J22R133]MDM0117212.1 hypothetical protein [Variovorax sp. J22R133]